jgi:hypothetical protein
MFDHLIGDDEIEATAAKRDCFGGGGEMPLVRCRIACLSGEDSIMRDIERDDTIGDTSQFGGSVTGPTGDL